MLPLDFLFPIAKDLSQKPKSVILSVAKDLRFAAINRQILRFAQNDILGFGIGY